MKGPTIEIIPEQKYYSCSDCDYFKSFVVNFGMTGIEKDNTCNNPEHPNFIKYFGAKLGNTERTPANCPLLKTVQSK